jgi:putative colanic acid biosynthesis acetyltransferase WcaF
MNRVRNDLFDHRKGLDRGRPRWFEGIWYTVKCIFFLSAMPWPSRLRTFLLRVFGAKVGSGVYIKPRVNIHLPWKLELGDHTWVGEEVFILNLEPVQIGAHCCISPRAFICTGNHDYRDITMKYRNAAICLKNGAWVGAQCFVGPGVTMGEGAVATAGSVVLENLPAGMISKGNPCRPVKPRWRD